MTQDQQIEKLRQIARQDSIYLELQTAYEESRKEYYACFDKHDSKTQRVLNTFAYTGQMRFQRLLYLACTLIND